MIIVAMASGNYRNRAMMVNEMDSLGAIVRSRVSWKLFPHPVAMAFSIPVKSVIRDRRTGARVQRAQRVASGQPVIAVMALCKRHSMSSVISGRR